MAFRFRGDIRDALSSPLCPTFYYRTLYLDPPWEEVGGGRIKRGADSHYAVMKQSELLTLPIGNLAEPSAHIYLWVTNNFLEDGLELLSAWRFQYKTTITWAKDRFGLGQYFRGQTEHCLFGVRGVLPYKSDDGRRLQGRTLITAPRQEHSAKPKQMREMIDLVSYGPKIELFGRDVPDSWDAIGNELTSPSVAGDEIQMPVAA